MTDKPVAELLVNDGEPWGCRYDDNITLAGVDGWIPLYTTPPTQPLTTDQIATLFNIHTADLNFPRLVFDVRVVEKAHGIGENNVD
jgi:hypothetical protein